MPRLVIFIFFSNLFLKFVFVDMEFNNVETSKKLQQLIKMTESTKPWTDGYFSRFITDVKRPRYKRYVLYKTKWKKKNLSYEISKYSTKISRQIIDVEISRAFQLWSSVVPLNIMFVQPGNGDIIIRFEKFHHGDVPFDGAGSVLAHTIYPITMSKGDQKSFIHFDDSENWTANSTDGINLFQTALHEVGHSLGLKHSNVMNSVMWPGRVNFDLNFTLEEDDIKGIQTLYGIRIK